MKYAVTLASAIALSSGMAFAEGHPDASAGASEATESHAGSGAEMLIHGNETGESAAGDHAGAGESSGGDHAGGGESSGGGERSGGESAGAGESTGG